jgi:hypothetical protein
MKTFTLIVVAGAALAAGSYLYGINKSQYKIVLTVTGRIHKVTAQGVSLMIKYNIKNPTTSAMRMTPPLIRITVNGKQIATSNMREIDIPENSRDSSGKIQIRANAETGEIESEVMVPWVGLISVAPDLVSRFQNSDGKTKVTLKVFTQSRIYTLLGVFPYEQNTSIKV